MLGAFTGSPALPGLMFFSKEITLAASNRYSREAKRGDFERGVKLAGDRAALIEPLVTHVFALDEVAKALATADENPPDLSKCRFTTKPPPRRGSAV